MSDDRHATANAAAWPADIPRPGSASPDRRVRVERADGIDVLLVECEGQWVSVHSRRDAIRDADRQLPPDIDGASTLFVVGLGLGYVLDALERRGWTGTVVAFEPDPAVTEACLRRRDWTAWLASRRLMILAGPDYEGLDRVMPGLDPNRAEPVLVVNPVLARVHAASVDDVVRRAARAWFGARANQEARRRHGGRYLTNTLRNAPRLATAAPVEALDGAFARTPAVVVAAGPSLDRNMDAIAAHRDRAVIVAVDTALRPLLAHGIAPDLVVAVDPGESNARHLVDLPPCPGVYLVTEGSVDGEALRTFEGRLFVFRVGEHHPWPWLREHGVDCARLRAWGSVLTTAFDLALRMGCDPIALAGADLGFTGGQPYARGTTFEEEWRREAAWGQTMTDSWALRVAEWPETVEVGVDGGEVRTAPHLIAFRDWIAAEAAKAEGRTIVNATGRGVLRGAGIGQSTLDDLLARCPAPAVPPPQLVERAHAKGRRLVEWQPPDPPRGVLDAWCAFGGLPQHAVLEALNQTRAADASAAGTEAAEAHRADAQWADTQRADAQGADTQEADAHPIETRTPNRVAASPATVGGLSPALTCPDLCESDAGYLAQLAKTHRLRMLSLEDAAQPLADVVAAQTAVLQPDEALVIVDRLDVAVGAQVRRAVDPLLCARPDVWLEYRRFADYDSRVTVIRADAPACAPAADRCDVDKWDDAHAPVAESVAPFVAACYRPRSVVDIGCGAGFWLRAFESGGATRLRGFTPCAPRPAAHADVQVVALERLGDVVGREIATDGRFDLCLALEVAQALPPEAHRGFVDACARLSDVVVFSSRLPGGPGMSPYSRPLAYWSDLFWTAGYVLDDRLRPMVEERWGFPRTVYDVLVAFTRRPPGASGSDAWLRSHNRTTTMRIHDLYEQSVWWAVRAQRLAVPPPAPPVPPTVNSPSRPWIVPAWRMGGEPGASRIVHFRTDAARWFVTDARATLAVRENDRHLPRVASPEELAVSAAGGWLLVRDELTVRSSDGTDPRTNGRSYVVELPAFVTWAEEQSLADVLRHAL